MTRTRFLFTLLILASILGGCSNKTTLQFDPGLQTVHPAVKAGDTIRFQLDSMQTFAPTFPLGSPCTPESDLQHGACTVAKSAPLNGYPYLCSGCADPEIVVYSDTQTFKGLGKGRTPQERALSGTQGVFIGCVTKTITLFPSEVKEHQSDEVEIHWEVGGSMPVSDWSVPDLHICKESPPFNSNNPACTIDKTKVMPMMSYPYSVTGPSCSANAGQGKITIQ